jgi:hypothetical protein
VKRVQNKSQLSRGKLTGKGSSALARLPERPSFGPLSGQKPGSSKKAAEKHCGNKSLHYFSSFTALPSAVGLPARTAAL